MGAVEARKKPARELVSTPSADGDHATFCRICEAYCGMIATVKEGKIISVVPDFHNPHSQGHVCVKGANFHKVTHDPDRVTRPMKRVGGPGDYVPVSWEEALHDIATRLKGIIERHGPEAVASYKGNPIAFSIDASIALRTFLKALKVDKYYGAGSQDTNARFAANYMIFGSAVTFQMPDLPDCDFLLIFGGNPLVSNGSLIFAPRIRHDLDGIAERGRVVVIDPRRSETAQRYEHVPIRSNGDIWMLLAMLRIIVEEDGVDAGFVAQRTHDWDRLRQEVMRVDLAQAAERCGVPLDTIRALTRCFIDTPRAAAYGRLGIGRGPFATLENFLLTAINAATGKIGKPGTTIFNRPVLAGSETDPAGGYGETSSRIGNFPSVAQFLPSAMMPADILEDGPGKVRALFCTGGNVLLAAPGGKVLEDALEELELMVSLDFYENESHRHAHYILPTVTFFERDDMPTNCFASMIRPFLHYTPPVIEPVGEARSEYDIFTEILRRMSVDMPLSAEQAKAGVGERPLRPMELMDVALRMGPVGDRMGERDGWSFDRLRDHPHGVMVDDLPTPYDNWEKIAHSDRRMRLWHVLIEEEFARLWRTPADSDALKLISRRDIRSMNSWMHNVDRLVRSQYPTLLINPADAMREGVADGEIVALVNEHGAVTVAIAVSDEMVEGTVCYPHGFGHDAGWTIANGTAGSNMNLLLGIGVGVVERVSGMTVMDGIDVRIERITGVSTA